MVKERKKLENVKGESAGRQILDLTHMNKMGECDTHISCRFELEATNIITQNP